MKLTRDLYEILGVPRDADDKTIRDAYRALALTYHPNRNQEPGAEDRFKEIAAAHAVLSNPEKRKEYDAHGLAAEDLFTGLDLGDLFGAGDLGLFERLFGFRRAAPGRGRDLEVELELPLARALTGGEERVAYRRAQACDACHATGAKEGKVRSCETCKGTGQVSHDETRRRRAGEVLVRTFVPCAACGGRGATVDEPCPACHGRGEVEHEAAVNVKVPAGFEDGMVLRVRGHGLPGAPGRPPGDLLVVLRSAPDPRFERSGADLWRVERLSVPEAVLGGTRTVATLDGAVELEVPPGTQSGSVLRLTGKGLPAFGGGGRGHLYLRVLVHVPEQPTAKQRKLYEKLRELEGDGPVARPSHQQQA